MSEKETAPKVELSSFFDLQKRYLHGSVQKSKNRRLNRKIRKLQRNLDSLNTTYEKSNATNADLLTKQQQVHHILDEEKKRLMTQQSLIENDYVVKQRETQFNNSYRLRQHEVNKMMAVVVFGLFIMVLIILLQRHLGFIPDSVITIAMIVVICVVGIYSIRQIIKILLRSKMDFTKLYLDEPEELKKQSAEDGESTDLLAANDTDYCVGPACCHEGTSFDNEQLLCIPDEDIDEEEEPVETFRNLQPSMCHTPYEEGKYAKI